MAREDRKTDEDGEGAKKAPAASSTKKIAVIAIAAVALVGVSVGGTLLVAGSGGKHDEPAKKVAKKKAADDAEADAEAADDQADAAAADDPDAAPAVAQYLDFEQPFVVNFQDQDQLRYLQITVSVMATDAKVIEEVKRHMPLIRNNLVMLFSGQTREGIISREGKEKIRVEAQAEVQKVLKEQTGKPGIKSLYFTSFVMQ